MSNWIKPRIDASRSLWANDSDDAVSKRLSLYDLNDEEKKEVIDDAKTFNKWYNRIGHVASTLAGAGLGGYVGNVLDNKDALGMIIGAALGGGLGFF